MAKLSATIGSVTADVTIPDATAQQIVAEYNDAYHAPDGMTNRQALEWFVRHLAGHAKAVSDAHGVEAVVRLTETKPSPAAYDWQVALAEIWEELKLVAAPVRRKRLPFPLGCTGYRRQNGSTWAC